MVKSEVTVAVVVLLGMVAMTLAQPCIECKECKTDNCRKSCQKECPKKVDSAKCQKFGKDAGLKIGKDSCATTQKYCGAPSPSPQPRRFPATLSQCENIAYGECQKNAKATASAFGSPCRTPLLSIGFKPYAECTKTQWNDFFNGEVDELCKNAVSVIDP